MLLNLPRELVELGEPLSPVPQPLKLPPRLVLALLKLREVAIQLPLGDAPTGGKPEVAVALTVGIGDLLM